MNANHRASRQLPAPATWDLKTGSIPTAPKACRSASGKFAVLYSIKRRSEFSPSKDPLHRTPYFIRCMEYHSHILDGLRHDSPHIVQFVAHCNSVDRPVRKKVQFHKDFVTLSYFFSRPIRAIPIGRKQATCTLATRDTSKHPGSLENLPSCTEYTRVPQCRTTSTHIQLSDRLSRDSRSPPVSASFCQGTSP